MFKQTISLQTESNTVDILRKYGPYLIVAGAAVGSLAALYYLGFTEGSEMVSDGYDAATGTLTDNNRISLETSAESAIDAGLDGSGEAAFGAW